MARPRGVHPGKVLLRDFLEAKGISQNALARDIGVPPRRINEIVLGKRGISADTAIRLAKHFGNSEKFWMQLQVDFDLEEARKALIS
ncbi:MAG TPA: HigA family addiction module antitoxin [Burkholderiales bacterium]|jgi:addiction module HigA family antidote|nr:HigA family addiction module antitoxin [Burkholderiales bacterium]